MPLTRYQIRNEYSLADPELYRAADKDDPEALLEGVAMAGLVGVLRQLGDLAEFAAEIFHDLHDEVMATAARGHGLMVRVQQLEAEFPSIEKAFLSQTSHSLFFYNAGVDWHPNLRTDQNLITQEDLPRFVMDSYEECRGPPRLFLLDKFDIAGAGACLKRYTDPAFFKVEAASSGIAKVEVQRDKKIRKVKKKGSRWRNGETPEVLPTSHTKLHQLFLEERVENGSNDPARLVKLKKRQLNGSPLLSQTKKSYMEKFLQTPSPEHKVVHEISLSPAPLKLTSNSTSEPRLEILDIRTVSPAEESLQRKRRTCLSPIAQETVLKPSMGELSEEVIDGGILKVPAPNSDGEIDEIPSTLHKVVDEKELAVDGESKTDGSVDGPPSDDIASEIDNYMDALTTMESEMDTDTECRPKNDLRFLNIKELGTDSGANEEHQEVQAQFSDSQSIGNSNASDDEIILFKKGRSSFSYSDTRSNFAENTPSDGDGAAKTESCVAEIVDTSSDQRSINEEILGTKSHEHFVPNGTCIEVVEIPSYTSEFGEASCNSCLTDSNPMPLPLDPGASFNEAFSVGPELDETSSGGIKLDTGLSDTDRKRTNLGDNLPITAIVSDVPSPTRDDFLPTMSAESHPADELNGGDPNVFSDALLHLSNDSVLAPEKNSSDNFVNEMLQTEYADDGSSEHLVNGNIGSPHSIISSTEELLLLGSTLPELEPCSSITLLPDSLPASIACNPDVEKPDGIVSEVDDAIPEAGVNSGNLTPVVDTPQTCSFSEQKFSEITDDAPPLELDSAEVSVLYSGEKTDLEGVCSNIDCEEIGGSTCNVDRVGSSAEDHEDHVHLDDIVTGTVQAEAAAAAAGSDDGNDAICLSPDIVCSPSKNFINMQESLSTFGDSNQKGLEIHELSPPRDLDSSLCSTVSYNHSNSKLPIDVPDSSLDEQTQNSLPIGDVTTAPTSSKQNDQDMESKSPHQTHLSVNSEDAVSSPTCYLPEPRIPLKQALELQQGDQIDVESLHADEASPKLSNLQFEQIQAPNCIDQEGCFDSSSESSPDDVPSQPSASEVSLQLAGLKLESSEQTVDPSESIFPSFGMLPQASQVNLEEMPPLPPLPPMQWRIGKFQHAPLDSGRELVEHTLGSFPPIPPPSADEKAQFGFPALEGEIQQLQNPFLPISAVKDEKSQHVSEYLAGNLVQPSPFSLQKPTMVNDACGQHNLFTLEGTQSLNPFLTLPAMSEERPQNGFLALEGERIQPSSNPLSPIPTVEDTTSTHAPVPLPENLIQPLNQLAPETGLEDKKPQHTSQNSEREKVNHPEAFGPPPTMEDEQQPRHGLVTPEGETAWSSNTSDVLPAFEDGKPNGNPSVKLPRPRSPFIDAVAAHDKSKMRKATERVRPQIAPQVDERDSLLEQIRTKSFNLKPAVATRPSIQGPKTNLKVAAILEKANAIRQAFAGSDEDDDADSWSDS